MRFAKKVDRNHDAIKRTFRACGYTVHDFSKVGHGCPDLVVERGEIACWVEIKDGEKVPSKQKLTGKEALWHELLKRSGIPVYVVTSVEDVIAMAKEPLSARRDT